MSRDSIPGVSLAKAIAAPAGVYRVTGIPNCLVTVDRERNIVFAIAFIDGVVCRWSPDGKPFAGEPR